jgi:alkane 1-monooxygenase
MRLSSHPVRTDSIVPLALLGFVPVAFHAAPTLAWLVPPAGFLCFALADRLLGAAPAAPRESGSRALLQLYVPAQIALLVWGLFTAARETRVSAFIGLALMTGAVAGVFGMLTAHELIHSRRHGERALGTILLTAVAYPHFRLSHLMGHHRRAALPSDPATARRGESAYRFILRSIIGQFAEAWEHGRRRRVNPVALGLAVVLALWSCALAAGGWRALLFLAAVSAVAIAILELFNYVAHYGLARRVVADGAVEPLGPQHSWNTARRLSNWLLLNGGRHSDHHRAPALGFSRLVDDDAAPQLPSGLGGAILLALVPPLWRRVMDPRVAAATPPPAPQPRCGGGLPAGDRPSAIAARRQGAR